MARPLKPGDPVVFDMRKVSAHPGPRAQDVSPAPHGETYTYLVPKFWRVKEVREDGKLVLYTRRGKTHICDSNDLRLRRPGLVTWLLYRRRFPSPGVAQRDEPTGAD